MGLRVGNGLGVRFNTFARTFGGFSVAGASVAGFPPGEWRGSLSVFQLRLSPTLAPPGILESPFARPLIVCVCRLSFGLRVESVKKAEKAERHGRKYRASDQKAGQRGHGGKRAFHRLPPRARTAAVPAAVRGIQTIVVIAPTRTLRSARKTAA